MEALLTCTVQSRIVDADTSLMDPSQERCDWSQRSDRRGWADDPQQQTDPGAIRAHFDCKGCAELSSIQTPAVESSGGVLEQRQQGAYRRQFARSSLHITSAMSTQLKHGQSNLWSSASTSLCRLHGRSVASRSAPARHTPLSSSWGGQHTPRFGWHDSAAARAGQQQRLCRAMATTAEVASTREQHGAVGKYLLSLGVVHGKIAQCAGTRLPHEVSRSNDSRLICRLLMLLTGPARSWQAGAKDGWTSCRSACGRAS